MNIFLIRHPAVDLPDGICYGRLDPPLAPSFRKDLREYKMSVKNMIPDICYSSPLTRCRTTADYIFENNIHIDDRLTEMNFGKWEGKKWTEIDADSLNRWMKVYTEEGPPGGESFNQLQKRVVPFWHDLIQTEHNRITIVTHAGVIRALLSHLLHVPLDKVFALTIDLCSITSLKRYEKHLRIEYINRPLLNSQ